ncbi:MAG: BatA domain-containing protein [Fuerstiella sp.]
MSFLSIAFLAALPLAAAPILLHLFDRRRNVVIEWAAMEFLLQAATRRTSARRLKQWLLLLLRVLAVTALVLALARPMLPGNWFGTHDRTEVILVLDNSMSTQRSTGDATLFSQLLRRSRDVLSDLQSGDTVRILAASPYPVWATAAGLRVDAGSAATVVGQLETIRPTDGSSDLLAALFTAVQADFPPDTRSRRVVLLTDGQAADWKVRDENGWRRFQQTLKLSALPTELEIVEIPDAEAQVSNLSVADVRSNRTVVGVNQPFTVTARVTNHSTAAIPGGLLHWRIDGSAEHQEPVPEIGGRDSRALMWHHSFARPGVYAVSCEIDVADRLDSDNRGTVVIEVVNQIPVLVVEGSPGRAEMQQDAYFVQAAMGYRDGEPLLMPGVHYPDRISPAALERSDLSGYPAVIIPNLTDLSEETVERLNHYVFNGGGLWLALGPRTDIERFNQFVFANGDGLAPLALEGIVDESGTENRRTTINPSLRDHPATRELADVERLDTSDVRVFRRIRFVPPAQDQDVSVLLSLTNGEPLAVEKFVGRGRVIVQGVALRMDRWSELAQSQAFVVMIQDWLSYLTQPQATRHNLTPGDPILVHLSDAEHRDAILSTPHGDEIDLAADVLGEDVVFRSSRTILPGNYFLQLGLSGDRIPFHVSRDPAESDLASLTQQDRNMLDATAGLSRGFSDSSLGSSSHRDPVWPLLLMLLIGFMSAELLLAGLISRERFGAEEISEMSEQIAGGDVGFPTVFAAKQSDSARPPQVSLSERGEPVGRQSRSV